MDKDTELNVTEFEDMSPPPSPSEFKKPQLVTRFCHGGPPLADVDATALLSQITDTNNNGNSQSDGNKTPLGSNVIGKGAAWRPFSDEENERLENGWEQLEEWQRWRIERGLTARLRRGKGNSQNKHKENRRTKNTSYSGAKERVDEEELGPAVEEDESVGEEGELGYDATDPDEFPYPHLVPVGLDALFSVDLLKLSLFPVFWSGNEIRAQRGSWFYPSGSQKHCYPCPPLVSVALEKAYDWVKPWYPSYADGELRRALEIGPQGEDKLTVNLGDIIRQELPEKAKRDAEDFGIEFNPKDKFNTSGGSTAGRKKDEVKMGADGGEDRGVEDKGKDEEERKERPTTVKTDLDGWDVIFQSGSTARLYYRSTAARFSKTVLTSLLGGGGKIASHAGGTLVLRGWDTTTAYAIRKQGKGKEKDKKVTQDQPESRAESGSGSEASTPLQEGRKRRLSDSSDGRDRKSKSLKGRATSSVDLYGVQEFRKQVQKDRGQLEGSDSSPQSLSTPSPSSPPEPQPQGKRSSLLFSGLSRFTSWGVKKRRESINAQMSNPNQDDDDLDDDDDGGEDSLDKDDHNKDKEYKDTTGEAIGGAASGTKRDGDGKDGEVDELVLVIHGIGQKLAATYASFSFVHCINQLRSLATKQASESPLKPIVNGRRVQVLPIMWRSKLDIENDEGEGDHEEEKLDNRFTLEDIEVKGSIPLVRAIVAGLVIDVPYYLSPRKTAMIEAVIKEVNRVYRLFVQRNPGFATRGKVSIIAHSLGAALASDILSNQPTIVPPLEQMDQKSLKNERDQFIFNVNKVFFVGSPVGLFYHIHRTQLIARKGRERSQDVPPDIALDRAGRNGCLALNSLYNIYSTTDPVAYCLNACVDSKYAKMIKPIAIPSTTSSLLSSFGESVAKMSRFLDYSSYFRNKDDIDTSDAEDGPLPPGEAAIAPKLKQTARPKLKKLPTEIYQNIPLAEMEDLVRAERRMKALNPQGCLDFYLPSEGLNQYLDAVASHGGYWYDPRFCSFILTQLFAEEKNLEESGREQLGQSV